MSEKINDPFWINDPSILFKKLELVPRKDMTNSERLNALTRLLFLITLGLYIMNNEHYLTVLIIGLFLIFILQNKEKEGFSPRRGAHDPCHTCGFDSQLSYINSKYETSPQNQFDHTIDSPRSWTHAHYKVIPVDTPAPYREIWRNEPRWCNEFSQFPNTYNIIPGTDYPFSQPENKCFFEDQISITNTSTGQYGPAKKSVCSPVQSNEMTNMLTFRNNIMGQYIDQIESTRQHNCTDFKPGRKTF